MFLSIAKTLITMTAAHALAVLANWMVQLVVDFYRSIRVSFTVRSEGNAVGLDSKELKRLARRIAGNTLKGSASLILASVGAGLGTVLIRPSTGTWIGNSLYQANLMYIIWFVSSFVLFSFLVFLPRTFL